MDWHWIDIRLTQDWRWIGTELISDWHWIGTGLALDWHRIGTGLTQDWHRIDTGLVLNWQWIGIGLTQDWHWIGVKLALDWYSIGIGLVEDILSERASIGVVLAYPLQRLASICLRLALKLPDWRRFRLALDWCCIGRLTLHWQPLGRASQSEPIHVNLPILHQSANPPTM